MNTLVVYYSLTGTTETVAKAIAEAMQADIEPVICLKSYSGVIGYLRAGRDSWRGRLPAIEPGKLAPENYDLVLIGTPVWASHSATPIRTYIQDHRGQFNRLGLFVTYGGSGDAPALAEMAELAGAASEADLAIRTETVKKDLFGTDLSAFVDSLRLKEAA